MNDVTLRLWAWQEANRTWAIGRLVERRRCADERGEGVISAAIAVLVFAFLGALMWVGFKATLGNTQSNVDDQVNQIGQ